jgi:endonuclease YncB( thermonuclease family)
LVFHRVTPPTRKSPSSEMNDIRLESKNRPVNLRRLKLVLWAMLLVVVSTPLQAAEFTGRVVGITDGDTITVLHNGRGEKIRLNGID